MEKQKKKAGNKKKNWVIPVLILILCVIGGVVFFIKKKNTTAKQTNVTVQSATVEKGTITNTIDSSGTIASGDSTELIIPDGIKIKKILVFSGDRVKKGDKLATVTEASAAEVLLDINEKIDDVEDEIDDLSDDADDSSTDEYLQKIVLEDTLAQLKELRSTVKAIRKKGAIVANYDGVVDEIYASEATQASTTQTSSSSSNTSNTSATASNMSLSSSQYTLTFLSTEGTTASAKPATTEKTTAKEETTTQTSEKNSEQETTTESTKKEEATTQTSEKNSEQETTESTKKEETTTSADKNNESNKETIRITNQDLKTLSIETPQAGTTPQSSISSTDCYSGTISWDCKGTFEAEKKYTATVILTSNQGYAFQNAKQYTISVKDGTISSHSPSLIGSEDTEGNQLKIEISFEVVSDQSATTAADAPSSANSSNQTTMNAAKSVSGGGTASQSSSSTTTSSTENTSTDYSVYGINQSVFFTIASSKEVVVDVDVNELDINSVEVGQTASISLDAIENETFSGTITSVSNTPSSSNSGNVKYMVEVTLDKSDDMKIGMSASVTINVEESADTLVIPINALQEKGDSSFVYTKKDSDGNLSGEVEVETGLSSGSQVEIKSGLSEGDTVYYTKIESNNSDSFDRGDMKDNGMPGKDAGMGEQPGNNGDNQRPQGGGPNGNN